MKYYAVIDTNVIVSAMLKSTSVPGNILELTFSGSIIPLITPEIINEYREVLSRAKFHWSAEIVDSVVNEIERIGICISPNSIDIELPDPKDRVFYEVVMEKRTKDDAYLVTGNIKHFPSESFIVTPREMLDIINLVDEKTIC